MSLITGTIDPIENLVYAFIFGHRIEFFATFVLVFVGRKLLRAIYGGRYTNIGLIISPLLYLGFTAFTFIGLGLLGLMLCSVGFAFGLGLSGILKGQLHFFEKNGQLYYKRSVAVVLVWTAAFVLRLYIFIFYDITVGLVLSIILSFLTGLIIGEAFQIAVQKRIFDYRKINPEVMETENEVPSR